MRGVGCAFDHFRQARKMDQNRPAADRRRCKWLATSHTAAATRSLLQFALRPETSVAIMHEDRRHERQLIR